MNKKVAVFRRERFNAAHRLYNPRWDDATNFRVFGKCSNPHYHGHNYELEVKVTGEPQADTGFVMDMKVLSDLVQQHVVERFDHKNLNLDTAEFKELNPTAEHIAMVIYDLLRPHINKAHDMQVRLYETPRNFVEYPA
ncbi:6-carboxytetrahydropterin synthase [Agriterribacter sp.]|uniref:6-pyruvoyl trahydropterin synthase family protein n=1 Tax=Agriterribacter sp. TaxID=2821509 RepID=UPI002CA5153F|nr:6-carboxytetrahydropterin synthase [Agriterribacter sp.]HRO46440.1 6-carboxytetrahydropterin synthase [Agriterribacter sp.]HRQ17339.1 6-carboxytetrahydropterin synthase [Agriterribacter sp.]